MVASITMCIKKSRNHISKTACRRLSADKVAARRSNRRRVKQSDRLNDFDGCVRPSMTSYDIT